MVLVLCGNGTSSRVPNQGGKAANPAFARRFRNWIPVIVSIPIALQGILITGNRKSGNTDHPRVSDRWVSVFYKMGC
jgi:hypothetical protein